jgi:hypothetical protein
METVMMIGLKNKNDDKGIWGKEEGDQRIGK